MCQNGAKLAHGRKIYKLRKQDKMSEIIRLTIWLENQPDI